MQRNMKVETRRAISKVAKIPLLEESGFYEAYVGFARNLRTWFLAYGVGGPVVFLTNPNAGEKIAKSGYAEYIAYLFLIGVALQVIAALLYKSAMWFFYEAELNRQLKEKVKYKAFRKLSESYSLEFFFDIATVACFSVATWRVLKVAIV